MSQVALNPKLVRWAVEHSGLKVSDLTERFHRLPLWENAIAACLDAETARIGALVAKVEAAIERLQKYRTALITAAVSGKIDVRKESDGN